MKRLRLLAILCLLLIPVCAFAWGVALMGIPGGPCTGTLGADLVTDGGFEADTETNIYISNFTVGSDSWGAAKGAVAGNIDFGGYTDVLRFTCTNEAGAHYSLRRAVVAGNAHRARFEYYVPAGQSNVDGISLSIGGIEAEDAGWDPQTTTNAWTAVDYYFNAGATGTLGIAPMDGATNNFTDAGGDDIIYIYDFRVEAVTFDSWTAGTGWAPQATAGSLTDKALKTAGTASNLSQDLSMTIGKCISTTYTTASIASTMTIYAGSTGAGTTRSTNDTFVEEIICGGDGLIYIKADTTSSAGTIDNVVVKSYP